MIKGNESHVNDFQFWDFYITFCSGNIKELDVWLSYDKLIRTENNVKQNNFTSFFKAIISKTMPQARTPDSFPLIMSQFCIWKTKSSYTIHVQMVNGMSCIIHLYHVYHALCIPNNVIKNDSTKNMEWSYVLFCNIIRTILM